MLGKPKAQFIQKPKPRTRTELQYLRGYLKHRYVQQAAWSARYGPLCKLMVMNDI